jgi:hypothetical protein
VKDPTSHILSDVAKLANAHQKVRDPGEAGPNSAPVTAREAVQLEFGFTEKYGAYGHDLARALSDVSGDTAFKSALDAVKALKPSPLLDAFKGAYGDPRNDPNHPALSEPQRLESFVNQFVGYVGLTVATLQKELGRGNEVGVRHAAKELLQLLDKNVTSFKVAGEVLTDLPRSFLVSRPSIVRRCRPVASSSGRSTRR